MNAQQSISEAISKALAGMGIEGVSPTLERPADMSHGDWSTNVALVAAKQAGKNPRELADDIAAKLNENKPASIVSVDVAGPGFINFKLDDSYFVDVVQGIDDGYGKNHLNQGEKMFVEHTQPNAFKEMHVGHLVNNIIGESIQRLIQNSGAEVRRARYHGDIGLHVAKALWAIKKSQLDPSSIDDLGKAYAQGAAAYEENETAKEEITALNKELYGTPEPDIEDIYQTGRDVSLSHVADVAQRMGSDFDEVFLESEVGNLGKEVVEQHLDDGIFERSEGAIVFPGEKYGLHTRVFVNSQGIPTYEAKDLGLVVAKRSRYPFTSSIVITDVEQSTYFEVIEKAIEQVYPDLVGKIHHVSHGRLRLSTGRISSRKGNNPGAWDMIDSLVGLSREQVSDRVDVSVSEDVAEAVGIAALKYIILKQATGKHIIFDEEKSLSFEGDSGPYIQYTAVRARSIVTKAREAGIATDVATTPETVGAVERLLERFPEAAERAARELEPHHVATYAIELASAFNSWYANEKIVDVDDPLSPYRVMLAEKVGIVLERALWLLGIRVPLAM